MEKIKITDRARALADLIDASTEGPWTVDEANGCTVVGKDYDIAVTATGVDGADAVAILAGRNDAPKMLRELATESDLDLIAVEGVAYKLGLGCEFASIQIATAEVHGELSKRAANERDAQAENKRLRSALVAIRDGQARRWLEDEMKPSVMSTRHDEMSQVAREALGNA